jgi:hypothetical protein
MVWLPVLPTGNVKDCSSRPSMALAGTVANQARVLWMRACSSSMVDSLSSNLGASMPATRAMPFFTTSQAMKIWFLNGSMSGAKRSVMCTLASKLRAWASVRALSSKWLKWPSMAVHTGKQVWDREMVMGFPIGV